eukprot:UN11159
MQYIEPYCTTVIFSLLEKSLWDKNQVCRLPGSFLTPLFIKYIFYWKNIWEYSCTC